MSSMKTDSAGCCHRFGLHYVSTFLVFKVKTLSVASSTGQVNLHFSRLQFSSQKWAMVTFKTWERPPRCWAFFQVLRASIFKTIYIVNGQILELHVRSRHDCQGGQDCYHIKCFFLDKFFFNLAWFFQRKPDTLTTKHVMDRPKQCRVECDMPG